MHEHHHGAGTSTGRMARRLWAAVALNVVITLAEVIGGAVAGSLALLSDAAHNLSDVVAVSLALWASRMGRRPPTVRHSYGFKRVEVMAALANAVVLIAVSALIAREAVVRLLRPEPVAQGVMLAVALAALAGNLGSVLLLGRHDPKDVNVRSAFLHMAQDALASLAVVVAALLAHTAAGPYVDPAAAILVGLVVLRSAFSLVRETLSTLLEGVPRDVDLRDVVDRVGRTFAPARLHHLHVWEIGPRQRALTAHVSLGREVDGPAIVETLGRIRALLRREWQINHATLEPEIEDCENADLLGRWDQPGARS